MALQQTHQALEQQLKRQRLVMNMLERIRQSLQLAEILNTTAEEVRQFLETDRVIIFQFEPDWDGEIVVESVGANWTAILSSTIRDPCFSKPIDGISYVERYQQGRVKAINDIYTAQIKACHVELLEQFQVKANLVVPILQGEQLWGLLVAHHCQAPRQWQPEEIEWLQQLGMQVGIAIQQSTLYEKLESELTERRQIQKDLRLARDLLEKRVAQRTAELASANQELQVTLEELQVAQEELRQQNEALAVAREMAESERRRYQDLFSEAPDGYLVTNTEGIIQEANRAAHTLLGVHQERLVNKPMALFIAESDRQSLRDRLTRLQPIQDWEVCLQPRSDQPLPSVVSMTSIHDAQGQPIGLRWLLRDISERKRSEQQIQQQAALIDISTDAIFVCDLQQTISFWSEGAVRLYGWNAQKTFGKKTDELFCLETSAQRESILKAVVENCTWHGELEQLTKDNRKIIVESRWTLVRDETGKPYSILVVNTDITAKKHLEVQFYRTQRLESLGTLASGIAHDLNNILQPILFITHLLRQKSSPLDEQTKERLQMLEESGKRGASLVKQILSFACGDGKEGEYTCVQLKHLLQEILQVAQKTFPKSIKIHLNLLRQNLWTVEADATQLYQVLMNLMVNARDAMPEGGTLTLSAENLFLDETYARMELAAQAGPFVVVTVADTGTGISPEIIERIFDPFFTTKEAGKGTGLGLATVAGIVKNHGGFVRVLSTVGQGSQFKVYLPAGEGEEIQITEQNQSFDGQGECVLIADDEAIIREIAKTSLEEHNYKTFIASDGIEAIALYAQYHDKISFVLMDLMMPEMDGLTAIRALQKIDPQLKIVITSGLVAKSKLNEAAKLGVTTFLLKPYTEKDLLNVLHGFSPMV